ncbi:hypothetical protein H2201_005898 [Coniosporium apollinis]|uniref:Uncharacterized protein n=1 Tax=Coniosporium apollinis TaxID=61459 RepID=A0ABQ9NRP8_9PEZI|nr:hypothetical protein H2201_005898 [Coniosporium apollinis]
MRLRISGEPTAVWCYDDPQFSKGAKWSRAADWTSRALSGEYHEVEEDLEVWILLVANSHPDKVDDPNEEKDSIEEGIFEEEDISEEEEIFEEKENLDEEDSNEHEDPIEGVLRLDDALSELSGYSWPVGLVLTPTKSLETAAEYRRIGMFCIEVRHGERPAGHPVIFDCCEEQTITIV